MEVKRFGGRLASGRRARWLVALTSAACAALSIGCQQARREARRIERAGEPQIKATVVTIRTTLEPAKRSTLSTLVISADLARRADEVGIYRLFDLRRNRVYFINDFDKSYRIVNLPALVRARRDAANGPLPDDVPRAQFASTGARRILAGVPATQSTVRLGSYVREIWFGVHPLIPPQLFLLEYASTPAGQLEPMTKAVDTALLNARGYPLLDHAEVTVGTTKIVVDRAVLAVEQKNVPASLLTVPGDFRDLTPQPRAPVARRPPASSPPPGQKTPGAE